MNFRTNVMTVALVSCGMVSTCLPSLADTETTTIRTTSFFSNGQQLTLPTTSTYVLVDPITGDVRGNFDPTRGLTDARPIQSGLVIINQDTGKVIATVDPSGRPIDVTSVPALDSLVLAIYTRRCDLERMITDSLAKGTIDTTQASLLRTQTDKIAADEFMAKQNGGILTYAEALSLAVTLNNIGDQLVSYTHMTPAAPLLGSRFVIVNGQIQMVR